MTTVLVTGANRGLGLEFARQYDADGWRVLAACRRASSELEELATGSERLTIHALDVADLASIDRLADELADQPVDVLLNNAGTMGRRSFAEHGLAAQAFGELDYEDWLQVLRVNLLGPTRMAEAFLPQLLAGRQKKLVTLTSVVGSMTLNTSGGLYAYRSSKAAVNAVMRSMAVDLLPMGILAVAIHPGWARTEMGGSQAPVDPVEAVRGVRRVIAELGADDVGRVMGYDGQVLPY